MPTFIKGYWMKQLTILCLVAFLSLTTACDYFSDLKNKDAKKEITENASEEKASESTSTETTSETTSEETAN